jgi:hypothetical protein
VTWEGRFRAPLTRFVATPRPLDGVPPFVWHGSIRSQEIAEQVLAQREYFGDFQRQLFAVDMAGIPERVVHEQLDLIGADVLPVLRKELAASAPRAVPGGAPR